MNAFLNFLWILLLILPAIRSQNDYRLPTTIKPTNYVVDLILNTDIFETNIFTGTVAITFNADATNTGQDILLHTNGINITSGYLTFNTENITITDLPEQSNSTTDILVISTGQALSGENYVLTLLYTGSLRTDEMYGFYKSFYEDENGDTKYLATTQFESTYARRAFPCFDEPDFKATFNISITYPTGYNALCNTPLINTTTIDGLEKSLFQRTPIMSTYLVAFIISEFTCSTGEDIEVGIIPYQVCSRDEASSTRQIALDLGPSLLRDLENFTAIRYSESGIGKMDQVAIPDFAAGAMENWGLVTYRETALLWDEAESSNRYKQRVVTVVAHEFTHTWFGNLVTLKWWSDVFLNEGFARFFEYFTTHNILPSWELDKQFVIEVVHAALESDAVSSSHALSAEASTPSEISSRFSTISYSKGGSILRMVKHFLGSTNFQTSVQNYLSLHKNNNTEPDDLWAALNSQAILPPDATSLSDVMLNWTIKAGYPLLNVQSSGNNIVITQKRFLLSGEDNTTWFVPISYTKSSDSDKFTNTLAMEWLTPYSNNLTITDVLTNEDWIILNNQQTGFFRINYDTTLWGKIITALNKENFDEIHVINRAQIVDDLFNLAKINEITYSTLLNYLSFLRNDIYYYPWYTAYTGFSYLLRRTGNSAIKLALTNYILNLGQTLYGSVPFGQEDPDNQIYTHKQVLALTWACQLGNTECISRSKYEFSKYVSTAVRPSKNLRTIIYCTALRNSDNITEDWNFLWNQFTATKMATEQITILSALGCATNEVILNNYLLKSINSSSGIRQQDALSAFSSVYTGNQEGVDIALDFLLQNYQSISNYYASMNSLSSLISGLAARFTNQQQITKLESLTTNEELSASALLVVQQALATARTNLEWTQSFENQLTDYFDLTSSGDMIKISTTYLSITIFTIVYQLWN